MTEVNELSPGMLKVLQKIQGLLNLAANNPNENEAAAASAKAQELLLQYNLDAALVERAGGAVDGRREEYKVRGGFYNFQRKLWKATAELNFCLYWTQDYLVDRTKKVRGENYIRSSKQKQRRHRLIGRIVNTAATRAMATYLEEAIERHTREALGGDYKQLWSKFSMSFREGMADKLVAKISERYQARMDEEERKEMEEAERVRETGRPTEGWGNALTIVKLKQSEDDANYDFIHGEGAAARRDAKEIQWRKDMAEYRARREAEYTAWAAAHPKEAAAEAKREERNANRRTGRRYYGSSGKDVDMKGYYMGRDAAKGVSLDPQTGSKAAAGRIR